ncbi:MAG TPA: hypothetical protein VG603_04710, partial [Chitinophagales bacterium]|nr:hypothetical protein [Chitinophagales bacterium]
IAGSHPARPYQQTLPGGIETIPFPLGDNRGEANIRFDISHNEEKRIFALYPKALSFTDN